MFEPDILLPQPVGGMDKLFSLQPGPRKLILKVLRCALDDALSSSCKQAPEAQAWILSNQKTGLFDFRSICSFLKFNPDHLRHNLAVMNLLLWISRQRRKNPHNRLLRGRTRGGLPSV